MRIDTCLLVRVSKCAETYRGREGREFNQRVQLEWGREDEEETEQKNQGNSVIQKGGSHPGTTTAGIGVEPALRRVRVSVMDGRLAGTPLVVGDLLHHHLLVVRGLRVRVHARGAAGVGVSVEGIASVGAGRVSWWGVAWWWGRMLGGHDLSALVRGHHLAVAHHRHVRVGHGRKPLHWDHPVGHPVQGHHRDSRHRYQAGVLDIALKKRERKLVKLSLYSAELVAMWLIATVNSP